MMTPFDTFAEPAFVKAELQTAFTPTIASAASGDYRCSVHEASDLARGTVRVQRLTLRARRPSSVKLTCCLRLLGSGPRERAARGRCRIWPSESWRSLRITSH